jgi:addiction module HigA family antidote
MTMHNPPHPGEFITAVYLEPYGVSGRELAYRLDVAPSTLSRILKGQSRVTPDMALRLSKALGRTPESWLAMQDGHDLWVFKLCAVSTLPPCTRIPPLLNLAAQECSLFRFTSLTKAHQLVLFSQARRQTMRRIHQLFL